MDRARVATVIARRFHVRFSSAQTWRILHQMGFCAGAGAAGRRTRREGRGHVDQGDVAAGGKTVRDQDAWLCFADEAGQLLRPPKACTWSRRGCPPLVRVRAVDSGRFSMAGLVCRKAGQRTRLVFRMVVHHGRKGEMKGFRERDFASLLDAAHQQLGGNIVLVWDNYSHPNEHGVRCRPGPPARGVCGPDSHV